MKKILFLILCIFMITPSASAQSWGNPYRQRNKNRWNQARNMYRQPQPCQQQQYPCGTVYPQQWGNYVQPVVFPNYGGNWSPYTGYQYTLNNPFNNQWGQQQNFYPQQLGWPVPVNNQWGQQGCGNTYYAPPRPNFAQLGMGVEMVIQSFYR